MSPELAFLLSLALRMAVAAAFVVIASMITERSGPAIGALIATLPISGGPSYVFLAMDHDDAFIAQSALASVPMNSASVLMSMAFILLVQRFSTAVSLAGGLAAWFAVAFARERGRVVARRRHPAQRNRVRDLPAAGTTLSRRQDAAGHQPLVRHSAARRAGRHTRRRRGHAVEHCRPADQRRHRAVSGRLHEPHPDPDPTHRRRRDRRAARQRPVGADRLRPRRADDPSRHAAARPRGRAQSRTCRLYPLESWAVRSTGTARRLSSSSPP